jgi:hypothetical protein
MPVVWTAVVICLCCTRMMSLVTAAKLQCAGCVSMYRAYTKEWSGFNSEHY